MVVKIKNARLAFDQNLFKPGCVNAEDTPAYSCVFLIPKGDPQLGTINAAIDQAAQKKWPLKYAAILKALRAQDKVFLHDGDLKEQYDGFEGSMFISARNAKTAPTVVDKDRTRLTISSGIPYAGCYVHGSIDVWAMDNSYGKRICATLRGVQHAAEGDAFAGSPPALPDEFDDLSDTGEGDDLT